MHLLYCMVAVLPMVLTACWAGGMLLTHETDQCWKEYSNSHYQVTISLSANPFLFDKSNLGSCSCEQHAVTLKLGKKSTKCKYLKVKILI